MFICDVTKARSFARNFVSRELSFISKGDVSYRFNGKNDNVVLELVLKCNKNGQEKALQVI